MECNGTGTENGQRSITKGGEIDIIYQSEKEQTINVLIPRRDVLPDSSSLNTLSYNPLFNDLLYLISRSLHLILLHVVSFGHFHSL